MARAIAIALVIGSSIGLIYSFVKRNQAGASPTLIRNSIAVGRVALIRIDGIRTTGMFINDQPVCELEVTVQPRQGQAFRARLSRRVTYVQIPQYQPGELLPGRRPDPGRSRSRVCDRSGALRRSRGTGRGPDRSAGGHGGGGAISAGWECA